VLSSAVRIGLLIGARGCGPSSDPLAITWNYGPARVGGTVRSYLTAPNLRLRFVHLLPVIGERFRAWYFPVRWIQQYTIASGMLRALSGGRRR
jgi:hypothetical protein